ncbi:hypothetical protein POM88_027867 [Heracleum sosnowskyi]|uniref:RRM domain-containing protein n=1 Tax=Heracleum sosnowskyi TaxID=360622 RepID=A0AAD8MRG3_9APIA|nr:hypothetical protein POM88_027867 [Heracleum sosnowskyi]
MVKGDEYEYNSTMLYVRDLDESVSDDDLYQHFNQFPGLVVCCVIAKHHKTHKSLGHGFVNYSNPQEAANAIKISNSTLLKNKPIRVQFSPCHRSTTESILFIKNLDKSVDTPDRDQVKLKQLHVKNLHEAITDHSLKALFFTYGCLSLCKVLRDSNGTSTRSGLVAFSTYKEASTALHAMNGRMILGKTLCITLEKKRKSRPKMHPIPMTAMTPAHEEGRESRPETQPIPMTPQPALPLPMHPSLHMHPPGGYGFGQQMFYGQMPPALFPLEPGHWYQQQLIPGVRLPARAPIPNTSVPQLFTGMTPGTGSSMPNSSCKLHMKNFYPRFDSTI